MKRRRGGTAKISVFHKKERPFCTAFTTGRWQLRRAFTSTRALRGERAGPPQRHCQADLFNWRFPQGEGVEGKGAGGQLCAVGSPQRARREVTSANGCPRTCTGCGRVKTVCRVPSGNFYSARPRREPGLVENDSKKIFFRSAPPRRGRRFMTGRAILCGDISICAPARGATRVRGEGLGRRVISIHAPCGGEINPAA